VPSNFVSSSKLAHELRYFLFVKFKTCSKGDSQMAEKDTAHLTADGQDLNDRDLKLSILEHLKNDGRLDLDELEISCRKDVVYLEGIIPSEIERHVYTKNPNHRTITLRLRRREKQDRTSQLGAPCHSAG
jgi:hypothetical protein